MRSILKELTLMSMAYLRRQYPPFVYSTDYDKKYFPIFCYHDIDASEFEKHLTFLSRNGYQTVACDEAVERIRLGRDGEAKHVLLTFDDGLSSLYDEVFPVLLKFNMKAVAFIVPGCVGEPDLLTWAQCREMRESGLVDFQSHSYSHPRVITELKIRRVQRMAHGKVALWEVPGIPSDVVGALRWIPVFNGDSLFHADSAYILPDSFWKECIQIQNHFAGEGEGRAARRCLSRLKGRYLSKLADWSPSISRKDKDYIFATLVEELEKSKESIERELPGQKVRHFAFPWHSNSPLSWLGLRDAGYVSGAAGLQVCASGHGRSDPVIKLFRVNSDFLYTLPGNGRKKVLEILGKKVARRMTKGSVYGSNLKTTARVSQE